MKVFLGPHIAPAFTTARHTEIEYEGVNSVVIIQLSPFISLYRSLLLALSLSLFHFRLNGGFQAGFRRNTFGFSAPSPFLSLRRSYRSLTTVSHSLPSTCSSLSRVHFQLNCGFKALLPLIFISLRRSHWSLPTVSYSLPTEWRLRSGLSTE
jgi:hypothetical protein